MRIQALGSGGGSGGQSGNVVPASTFTWAAGAASINVANARDFVATNLLTQDSTLTLTGGTDGCFGQIYVQQDATGGRNLTFVVAGRTQSLDLQVVNTKPLQTASSKTKYQYYFYTDPSGVLVVEILKMFVT